MKEEKHLIFFTEGMNLEHDRSMIVTRDGAGDPFCRHSIVINKTQTPCSQDGVEDGVLISYVDTRTTAAEESEHEVGRTLKSERICRIHHQNHIKNQKCGVFILLEEKCSYLSRIRLYHSKQSKSILKIGTYGRLKYRGVFRFRSNNRTEST